MENSQKENNKIINEQLITLNNRQNLNISGTNKIISLKPDLIQLSTNLGGIVINGENLELVKLDNNSTIAEIKGIINSIKFVQDIKKEPLFRKLFKWYF